MQLKNFTWRQTFISEELKHLGAPQPTPNSIWGELYIGLLACSCSCDFDAGKFPIELLVELLDKSRSVKNKEVHQILDVKAWKGM